MGCFLACFGSSKDKKRRIQRYRVQHRDHRYTSFEPVQSAVSSVSEVQETPISPVLGEVRDKPVEQLSLNARKKVTFDSNVKTYEHVSSNETSDPLLDTEESGKKEERKILENPCQSKSSSDDSSITSSSGSYPPNHRYQNCRDSDDEDEPLDSEDSDLDDEDEDDYYDDDAELEYEDEIVESNKGVSIPQISTEDFDSPMPIKPTGLNHNARDRSGYVHSVLNPVENLTQWKAVKAKGTSLMKLQKENFTLDQEPRISFSSEPSLSFKSKVDQHKKHSKNPHQEVAVDASLSNWLVSSEHTPVNKTSTIALDTGTPEKSMSHGSNSARSQEDRPILGALTVEELRQFSASSSPRKSPTRSPDEMPIIGTVGTYWNHSPPPAKGSFGASSYKGIPNTTSKYREDKRVNWHSTPFETRLERALNRGGAAEA
ncbi:unnamed protein product [Prunus armeniaca]|uniref:Uncharacterized protein n=1 Tax=Prunus armeniaca TaxID=36596 RepID=A0A6J5VVG7_PRUAR|nr:unnamed protein product [Prunus armeniaca]CAB4321751.1 unnamed protein product [Prunus armeniaca]